MSKFEQFPEGIRIPSLIAALLSLYWCGGCTNAQSRIPEKEWDHGTTVSIASSVLVEMIAGDAMTGVLGKRISPPIRDGATRVVPKWHSKDTEYVCGFKGEKLNIKARAILAEVRKRVAEPWDSQIWLARDPEVTQMRKSSKSVVHISIAVSEADCDSAVFWVFTENDSAAGYDCKVIRTASGWRVVWIVMVLVT